MELKEKRENVISGAVGAFLGSILGVICIVVVGQLGYVASISGVIMAVCSLKGYELLGGTFSKKGAVISSILVLMMTYFANRLDWAISVNQYLDLGVLNSFRSIGRLLDTGMIESTAYWGNLVMLYLFTLVGAVPTVISGLRGDQQPVIPDGQASLSAAGLDPARAAGQLECYPAAKGWLLGLRVSMLVSMFFPLVITFILLGISTQMNNEWGWLFASAGALVAVIICIIGVLPVAALLQSGNALMVRGADGTLWQVMLNPLNAIASYRFTSKTGALRALTWDRLTPQEQLMARESISRAIEDLSLGRISKWNMLTRIVFPLTDLTLIRENRWEWKISYQMRDRIKKTRIAKVYPGLRVSPEAESAQEPLPFRWSTCASSVVCTFVLIAIGWGIGFLVGIEDSAPPSRSPVAASAPASSVPEPLPGVQTEITDENYQSLFQPASNLGYEQIGVAYIKAPTEMFGREAFLDAYIPYGSELEYRNGGQLVQSTAHGMRVSVTIVPSEGNAKDAVDKAYQDLVEAGVDFYEDGVYETEYSQDYDIAFKELLFFEDNGTKPRIAILYTDVKQEHYYLCAQITYLPEQMDEEYPALIEELSDVFSINLPLIDPMG